MSLRLLNLVDNNYLDIDKIYLYAKDPFKEKKSIFN